MEHYRVQIAADGRMVLPASLRQQPHLEGGGLLIVCEDEGRLVLESVDDAVRWDTMAGPAGVAVQVIR
jgi:bifunctional DNA-binding transcriptional regulator/antitoxin component of YhaV-PrlF toxin-antitoxin module